MKPKPSPETDEALRTELRAWTVTASLPPGFEEKVWQQVARAERQSKSGVGALFLLWIEDFLSRPSIAASYVALLLLIGSATGYWQAHGRVAAAETDLGSRYVQTVDPYQMHRPSIR